MSASSSAMSARMCRPPASSGARSTGASFERDAHGHGRAATSRERERTAQVVVDEVRTIARPRLPSGSGRSPRAARPVVAHGEHELAGDAAHRHRRRGPCRGRRSRARCALCTSSASASAREVADVRVDLRRSVPRPSPRCRCRRRPALGGPGRRRCARPRRSRRALRRSRRAARARPPSSRPARSPRRARAAPRAVSLRRAWMRSSDAIVCRLFFTRWWTSRMVASLTLSSCSRRRASVRSSTSTSAPAGSAIVR